MFEIIVNLLILLGAGWLYTIIIRQAAIRATLEGIIGFVSLARLLLVISYVFVVVTVAVAHFFRFDVGVNHSLLRLVGLLFIVLPAFFSFCYLLLVTQINFMLNLMLQRYYKQNKVIKNREICLKIRTMVQNWAFLHRCLSGFRKVSMAEIIGQVCPLPEEIKTQLD